MLLIQQELQSSETWTNTPNQKNTHNKNWIAPKMLLIEMLLNNFQNAPNWKLEYGLKHYSK